MTTRKEALTALRDKVRDGECPNYYACRAFPTGFAHAQNANNGSMDAALALQEAVLPGWLFAVSNSGHTPDDSRPVAMIFPGDKELTSDEETFIVQGETVSCALLLAILEALIAEEEWC